VIGKTKSYKLRPLSRSCPEISGERTKYRGSNPKRDILLRSDGKILFGLQSAVALLTSANDLERVELMAEYPIEEMQDPRPPRVPAPDGAGSTTAAKADLPPSWHVGGAIPWESGVESRHFFYIGLPVESVLGYPRESWSEPGFWEDHLDPRDRDRILSQSELSISQTDHFELEYRMIGANGIAQWFRDSIRVVRDQTGVPRKLHGLMMEIDSLKAIQVHLEERLAFEERLARLSATFIDLPSDQIDQEIENGLETIVTSLGTDRAALAQLSAADGELKITHAWSAPGIPPSPKGSLKDVFPWIFREVQKGNKIVVSRVEDLPPEAENERQYALKVDQKATLIIPFWIGGKVAGGVSTGCFHREQEWRAEVIRSFQLAAEIFANAIVRKQTEEGLRQATAEIRDLKDRLHRENLYLREEIKLEHYHGEMVGNSEAIRRVLKQAEQVGPTDSTVLLLGETGTGKELLASSLHDLSRRRARPMVKVNCAALPASLVESELFGREKGAYTGALTREIGRFELANESTIFLDEIGELPLELQAKLLRVLQEGEFERLGSPRTHRANVRVIAATSRDLRAAVKEGRFREDLFYRLSVFPIQVPPLRDRKEDIPALVWHFIRELGSRMGRNIESVRSSTMEGLQRYSWPGNIRELRNIIERSLIIFPGEVFQAEMPIGDESVHSQNVSSTLHEVEREHILTILNGTRWRIRGRNGAAEILGLKPSTLESRMKKLNISRTR
jgi:formate hydrogenlyase transcriptional activator